jgi:GTP-binding protein Era
MKSGFITILGRPNVGKSTLLNCIIGQKLAIISKKPQTTRTSIKAIVNRKDAQMIFIDTPGIHTPKNKLGEKMIETIDDAREGCDIILFLVDACDEGIKAYNKKILNDIKAQKCKKILVINKVDLVKKESILELIKLYQEELPFDAIIPISASKDDGVKELVKEIVKLLPEGPLYYSEDEFTDQTERQIAEEIIREKCLRLLDKEVPHGIFVEIIQMKKRPRKKLYDIEAIIYCEKKSHKGIIIGKDGATLKRIGERARPEIEEMLDSKVNLQLWVKVKEGWRDDANKLREFYK